MSEVIFTAFYFFSKERSQNHFTNCEILIPNPDPPFLSTNPERSEGSPYSLLAAS
jgi:hypothetical protein